MDNQPIRSDSPALIGRDHGYPVQAVARAIGRAGETCVLLPLPVGILLDQRLLRVGRMRTGATRKAANCPPFGWRKQNHAVDARISKIGLLPCPLAAIVVEDDLGIIPIESCAADIRSVYPDVGS